MTNRSTYGFHKHSDLTLLHFRSRIMCSYIYRNIFGMKIRYNFFDQKKNRQKMQFGIVIGMYDSHVISAPLLDPLVSNVNFKIMFSFLTISYYSLIFNKKKCDIKPSRSRNLIYLLRIFAGQIAN